MKSLGSRARQRVLKYDNKSMIHKKKLINRIQQNLNFLLLKEIVKENEKTSYRWKNIFTNHISNKGLVPEHIKNSKN